MHARCVRCSLRSLLAAFAAPCARCSLRSLLPALLLSTRSDQSTARALVRVESLRVLVASDLLARGVDFGRVSLVFHYSLPRDLPTYLHRVGRTGRYATRGLSILLLWQHELPRAQAMLAPLSVRVHPLPLTLHEEEYMEPAAESEGSLPASRPPSHSASHLAASERSRSAQQATAARAAAARENERRLRELHGVREEARRCGVRVAEEAEEEAGDSHRLPLGPASPQKPRPSPHSALKQQHQQAQQPEAQRWKPGAPTLQPAASSRVHATAEALEIARSRGRQRALEKARLRARERHGLISLAAVQQEAAIDAAVGAMTQGLQWWEGLPLS